jgi:uncharacterized delta-60 repeat protein
MRALRLAPTVALLLLLAAAATANAATRPGTLDPVFAPVGEERNGHYVSGLVRQLGRRLVMAASIDPAPWRDGVTRLWGVTPAGAPDLSFGDGGTTVLPGGPGTRPGICGGALAVQPDGRLLLAGSYLAATGGPRFGVCRLTPYGRPDPSFGDGGIVTAEGLAYRPALAVDREGRIAVVTGGSGTPPSVEIVRFLRNGSPDPAFGAGGRVSIALPADGSVSGSDAAAAFQSGGRLVVALRVVGGVMVMRLRADGSVDTSFAGGGRIEPVPVGPVVGRPRALLVTDDGRLRIAVGTRERGFAVIGLTAGGRPDPAWGRGGLALQRRSKTSRVEIAQAAAFDARGGIVVGGQSIYEESYVGSDGAVARFDRRGRPDRSFGNDGLAGAGRPFFTDVLGLAVESDGDVVVAGSYMDKYGSVTGPRMYRLSGGYDDTRPRVAARARCRRLAVRIRDLSGMERVGVRARGRRVASTRLTRFTVQLPRRTRRVAVTAVDLAGNRTRRVLPVRRCR